MLFIFLYRYKNIWDIGIYLKKNFKRKCFFFALNNQILRQFFPEFHQIRFRTLTFCICKFEVNRDHTTGCTKCLSNLTLKCYANTRKLTHLWKLMHRSLNGADGLSPIWKLVFLPKALVQESKARLRRRTCSFHEPSLIHWINDLISSASESIRNAGFNLERLSHSFRLARPVISTLGRLWFRHRTFHIPNLMHKFS